MHSIVAGAGAMGTALAAALETRGDPPLAVLGRPAERAHPAERFEAAEIVFDFSAGEAVLPNVRSALQGGVRAFVIGTTAWAQDRAEVERLLRAHEACAVSAASFSPGVALFGRLVEEAGRLFGRFAEYDPYLVEWHRRTKADRPSGTALDLARRLIAVHPAKDRIAAVRERGAPEPDELDVAVIRAGSSPGMHLVGFDAPGESFEMRLTARDRSAYAAGAIAAARWLLAEPRAAGLHPFDDVLDSILAGRAVAPAPAA